MKITHLAIAFSALVFSSCTNDDIKTDNTARYISISTSVNDIQTNTKATTTYAGSTLGFFIDYGESSYTKDNVKWVKSSAEWTSEDLMLWQDNTSKPNITAYAPYIENLDITDVNFVAKVDQSLTADFIASDFMVFQQNNYDSNSGAVPIIFERKMTHLNINFNITSTAAVTIDGVGVYAKNTATYNGSVVGVDGDAIEMTPNRVLDGLSSYKYQIIIAPQAILQDQLFISIRVNGRLYSYSFDMPLVLDSNKSYQMTFDISPSGTPGPIGSNTIIQCASDSIIEIVR